MVPRLLRLHPRTYSRLLRLRPYSPELNPTERLWRYTRKNGTHNRYFADSAELSCLS